MDTGVFRHGEQGEPVLRCVCALQIIPALERIFSLVGADLRAWFAAMPRPLKLLPQKRPQGANALREGPAMQHLGPGRAAGIVGTIDRYYLSRHCAVSGASLDIINR